MKRLVLLLCVLGFSMSAFGQGNYAALSGQVLDASGAVVPSADVSARNTAVLPRSTMIQKTLTQIQGQL